MPIETRPLTVSNFADGMLALEIDEKLQWCLERFRSGENGDLKLASNKATITIKLHLELDPEVGGFKCSFEEASVKLPAKVRSGTVAVERDGILVVSTEVPAEQLKIPRTAPRENGN